MAIDLRDYVEVKERIRAFYERFPAGSIRTELARLDDDRVVFKALVYRDPCDPLPTTGWAYERIDPAGPGTPRSVENCETAAVGRALANMDLAGGRRPSREEMEKVQRLRRDARGRTSQPAAAEQRPGESPEARIRRLAAGLPLSRARRERIEARLNEGLSDQALHDLEAYLLALRARAP
ncbi:MAG TPA: hypothetical protein VF158_07590 [Longimicrobiales bacterium]